jgi:hypothetical protein
MHGHQCLYGGMSFIMVQHGGHAKYFDVMVSDELIVSPDMWSVCLPYLTFVYADSSPERSVSLAEPGPEQGGGAAACNGGPEDCPPELYNLTQLAEVSLAAAAGHLFTHPVLHSETARGYGQVRPPEEGTEVQTYVTSIRYPL